MATRKASKKNGKVVKNGKVKKASCAPLDLVSAIIEGVRKDGGDEYAQVLGSDSNLLKIRGVISSQCPGVDVAIGRGGWPLGRISIIHGGEGSGKTTLALHGCAECQRIGGVAVYIDKEYKLDPDYAAEVGVDLDKLVVMHPETLEDTIVAFKSIVRVIKANREATGERKPVIVVLDSINGCQAKETIEGEEGGRTYPNEARLWSKNLPEIAKICSAEDIALVLISQIRVKMNVMYGDPNEIAGGKAPKFHASVIAFVRYIGSIKEGTDKKRVGNNVEVEFKKNQIAPPFRKARLVMRYGEGVDYYSSLFEVALEQKWIRKKGTSYTYKGESLGQGKPGAIKTIRTDKPTRVALKKKLRGLWNVEARREEAKVQPSGESKGSKDNRGSKGKAAKGERRPISLDD